MSLRSVNLNLLPILRALLREANVTRAADVLSLSQSATSEALGRLRETLGDPLLVQVGRSMRLTPRALELLPQVEKLCEGAEALLASPAFDPTTSRRRFAFAMGDFGVSRLGPALLKIRRTMAPGISIAFFHYHAHMVDRLAAGDVDFAWLASFYLNDLDLASLRSVPIQTYRSVAIFDRNHPLAAKPVLTAEDLYKWPIVGVGPEPGLLKPKRVDELQGAPALTVAASVEHITLVPDLIRGTECWAVIPEVMMDGQPAGLVMREIPFPAMPIIQVHLVWSVIHDEDPAHRWLRRTLIAAEGAS